MKWTRENDGYTTKDHTGYPRAVVYQVTHMHHLGPSVWAWYAEGMKNIKYTRYFTDAKRLAIEQLAIHALEAS